jgi:hypothetical protein
VIGQLLHGDPVDALRVTDPVIHLQGKDTGSLQQRQAYLAFKVRPWRKDANWNWNLGALLPSTFPHVIPGRHATCSSFKITPPFSKLYFHFW